MTAEVSDERERQSNITGYAADALILDDVHPSNQLELDLENK